MRCAAACAALPRATAIIPLGPESLRGSSSLPKGHCVRALAQRSGRAGPPLLFDLAPRGVFRAPNVAIRAVGSYPTFSPLPMGAAETGQPQGFPFDRPPRRAPHRRFNFLWHYPEPESPPGFLRKRFQAPWRYQARCPNGVRTFLPPGRIANVRASDHPTRPAASSIPRGAVQRRVQCWQE